MKKAKLFLCALLALVTVSLSAQNIKIGGVVKDAQSGETIPYASVLIKGTSNGTVADMDGVYSLNAPESGVLVFSAVGYVSAEINIGSRSKIDVALEQDTELLDETIVVAFGTATKSSFTGSAAVVNEEKIAKSQVSSITNALAGAVAGVQLTSSNGAPGSTSTIRIRGFSSISAGQSPLIILDGAPYSGDLSTINQADVESMSVLKDAASNALYGARGANGVIIITTKSAKKGQATVTFDAKYGFNTRALRDYNVIKSPALYYETQAKALANYYTGKGYSQAAAIQKVNQNICGDVSSGGLGYNIWTVPEGESLIGTNGKLNPNATLGRVETFNGEEYLITPDDWSDIAYRTGIRQEYNVAVSAAQDRSSFYASIAYLDNEGITAASDMERLTGRVRADYQAKDWLKVGANFSYARFNYNSLSNNGSSSSTGNIWAFTSQMAPIYPAYIRNADGSIKVDGNGIQMMDYGNGSTKKGQPAGNAGHARPFLPDANPIQDLSLNTNNAEGNAVTANGYADFTILPGLKFTVNGTVYVDETRYTNVYNPYYGQFDSTGGTVSKEHDRLMTYNLQQLLNYNKSFGLHNIALMLGHEYYDSRSYTLWASKSKMFSQSNKELSGAVVDGKSSGSTLGEYNNEGYFFRGQYDYDNRIFASASFRRDASSRFHPDYRWGNFWSLGTAWIVSREAWFNTPWVDELKFKASVGSQGNDNIGSYNYTDLYDISNSSGNVATYFSSKGSKAITWETNTNTNVGAEFALFNRLTGSLEYFDRLTTDMLFSFPVAPSLGYSSYYANVGDMKNYGIELELGANLISTKNFAWDVNFNLTWLKNRITKLDDAKKTTTAYDRNGKAYKGYQSGGMFIAEDVSLYSWYLKDYAGVDPQTGESLWYYDEVTYEKDAQGNEVEVSRERKTTNTWSNADYYLTGDTTIAPFYGGFGTSFQVYGFDFSINFSYQLGGKGYDSTYATLMSSPTSDTGGYNYHADIFKAWTKDNTDTDVPRFQFGDEYTAASSTRFLTNASYLNIENINIGYTFPSRLTRKFGAEALRVYVAADNVWYFSARQGFDPRQTYSGSSNATNYSPMRTISGGITVKF